MDQLGLRAAALAATRSDRRLPYNDCLAFSALPWSPVMDERPSRRTRWRSWFVRVVRTARLTKLDPTVDAPLGGRHDRWKDRGYTVWRDAEVTWHTNRPDSSEIGRAA